jgi:probable HAF family extracellular repeat protein
MYTVQDLGALPGLNTCYGQDINTAGQIAGFCQSGVNIRAFLWSNGSMQDLGTLAGGTNSAAFGINDVGQVVGFSYIAGGYYHAFLWSNGSMQDLGSFPRGNYSVATDINNSGQVVGYASGLSGTHPFLHANGSMQDLGTLPGGQYGYANGINNSGQVVGYSGTTGGGAHAFLWSNGSMQDLGTLPGGTFSDAQAINTIGQVVGFSDIGDAQYHAFLWSNGSMQNLGTLPGETSSLAFAINDSGQVVGQVQGKPALLFANGNVQDLNALIPSNSGWQLMAAHGVNASGQITGIGAAPDGGTHAFLLTPTTPYKAFVQPPINTDGTSIFNANRGVIPVRFRLTYNNKPTCNLPSAILMVTRTAGGTAGPVANGTFFRTGCQYHYNLAASLLGVGTYRVEISINGIMVGHAVFALK